MRSVGGLVALIVLASLAGCKNYLASEEGRTVGEVTDDSAIHVRVKTGLTFARGVNGLRIDVDVREGVVTLSGRVNSEKQRTRALRLARGVPGVRDVEDLLVVDGPGDGPSESPGEVDP